MAGTGSEHNGHSRNGRAIAGRRDAPLCSREEYERLLAGMVGEFAPRLFAVIQEYGDRVDGRIAAWGLAFDDHAEIVGIDRGLRMSTTSAERSLIGFTHRPDITARVMWVHLPQPAYEMPGSG